MKRRRLNPPRAWPYFLSVGTLCGAFYPREKPSFPCVRACVCVLVLHTNYCYWCVRASSLRASEQTSERANDRESEQVYNSTQFLRVGIGGQAICHFSHASPIQKSQESEGFAVARSPIPGYE